MDFKSNEHLGRQWGAEDVIIKNIIMFCKIKL